MINKRIKCLYLLVIPVLVTLTKNINAQKIQMGIGAEINRMDFIKKAPELNVPYTIIYSPNIGLTVVSSLEYKITENLYLNANPSLGYYFMDMRSTRFTEDYLKIYYLSFSVGSRFKYKALTSGVDIGYNRFTDILEIRNGYSGLINDFATSQNLFSSSLFLGCHIYDNTYFYFKGTYYLSNLFKMNGLDKDLNLVGPVYLRPVILSLGLKVNLRIRD